MWQIAYKPDSVGHYHFQAVRQSEFAHGWIEGRKEFVLNVHVGAGQGIEKGRFSCIGIADEGNSRDFCSHPVLPVHCAPGIDLLEPRFELPNAIADQAPVSLELGFTRPSESDSTLLPLEVSPATHEARGKVAQLCKLHL